MNPERRAACAATGVRELLAETPEIRERSTGALRSAGPGDVAVLCRTNEQCQLVAEALAEQGIPAVVPRLRLLDTPEAQVACAALRLWLDPRDALAAAEIARIVTHAADAVGFVRSVLEHPGRAFETDAVVAAVTSARERLPDLDPVAALGAIFDALDVRTLCAAWGDTAQRLANLDALHAHAVAYVETARAGRDAPTLVGLLRHLEELTDDWGWGSSRSDRQALLDGEQAVTVSTWHRAKGREWPLVVLFGLESLRVPVAHGLHVASDAETFDLAQPLLGRWLRYWPNPYTTANQGGPARERLEATDTYAEIAARADREALRLLYVGWTRARDRLVFAAETGKLQGGLLGALSPGRFVEPAKLRRIEPSPAVPILTTPGETTFRRSPSSYPPARRPPSAEPAVPCTLGVPHDLGGALPVRGGAAAEELGRVVHAFFAADRPALDGGARRSLADSMLARFGLTAHLDAAELVAAAARLWRWVDTTLGPARLHLEWPLVATLPGGSLANGTADVVVRHGAGIAIIDHKTFTGSVTRAAEYSGQLGHYANAITSALGGPEPTTWVHLPLLGVIVELVRPELQGSCRTASRT